MELFKINVETKSIYKVDINNAENLDEYYNQLGLNCSCMDLIGINEFNDRIMVDDESLLKPEFAKGGFVIFCSNGDCYKIINNGLVCGIDPDGNTVEPIADLETIKNMITFMKEDEWKDYLVNFPPPTITSVD